MPHIFETLFGHHRSRVFTANLYAAWQEQILAQAVIRAFAEATSTEAREYPGKPPRRVAMNVVFAHTDLFQRAGPAIRAPRKNLVNIRALSQVHCSLMGDEGAPTDRDLMLSEVRSQILRRPDDPYGRPDRLLWIAEQEDEIQDDVNVLLKSDKTQSESEARRLERVMLFYGLPILSRTNYLITELSYENWGGHPNDLTYRRPTAFDGVDGDYFKQRRMLDCAEPNEWNKTADLASIPREASHLGDGAWEAVGIPLQMARVKRTAVVLSAADAAPYSRTSYAEHVRQAYLLAGLDWDNIPLALAGITADRARDDDRR